MSWKIEVHGHALVVTMNTNKANVQNDTFFSHLHEAMDRLDADHPHAPVVLTATGRIFSAGLDLDYTFPIFASGDAQRIADWWERYRGTIVRLFSARRPMIAAVNGHAVAGGLLTALCCDYRVGPDSDARFAFNEVQIGVRMPSIFVEIIRNAVGERAANIWTLFGRRYSARQALADGYLDEVVPSEKVVERGVEVAHEIGPGSVEAFVNSKMALRAPALRRIATLSVEVDREQAAESSGTRSIGAQTAALDALKARRMGKTA